ncbi:lymphocyte antigen 96 isoform X3 [Sceloporus undulatus]|uniref:lymphocyte antigen 96 isoform X3 n=1 Tax=Sceloporus undulatus TaxID=8520 RepID=UPI001C4C218A|nr:lymphocyte antigen 96 isoform X3 [Sceloporus undulatus]
MFQLAVMILSVYGFTMAEEKYLLCRSDDLDIFFSSCEADITTLAARIGLWHEGTKVLKWKTILCHGVDDDYSFCGTLKGETINTTVRISGAQPTYLQGEYTAVFEAFSGYFEELVACMNYTLIIKQKLH